MIQSFGPIMLINCLANIDDESRMFKWNFACFCLFILEFMYYHFRSTSCKFNWKNYLVHLFCTRNSTNTTTTTTTNFQRIEQIICEQLTLIRDVFFCHFFVVICCCKCCVNFNAPDRERMQRTLAAFYLDNKLPVVNGIYYYYY